MYLYYLGFSRETRVSTELVKYPSAVQETMVQLLVRKIPWRRDRPPTPVLLGFPGGSDGKESTCNVGNLVSIPELGRRRAWQPTAIFLPGKSHGQRSLMAYSP